MNHKHKNWFEEWFSTQYYQLLYENRNELEANTFIDTLIRKLNIQPNAKIWDMACGAGRHCVSLNKLGFNVIGTDLSEQCINEAKKNENDSLVFYKHDMRNLFRTNYFDVTLNLFTSFGYFENDAENLAVLANAQKSLKPNGLFILDYLNTKKVLQNLIEYEEKKINQINFSIRKTVNKNILEKHITVTENNEPHHFFEKVKTFTLNNFNTLFASANFQIVNLWGNYNADSFDEQTSDRLIIVGKKTYNA